MEVNQSKFITLQTLTIDNNDVLIPIAHNAPMGKLRDQINSGTPVDVEYRGYLTQAVFNDVDGVFIAEIWLNQDYLAGAYGNTLHDLYQDIIDVIDNYLLHEVDHEDVDD